MFSVESIRLYSLCLNLPNFKVGTILEVPSSVVEVQAMIGLPSPSKLNAAPRIKSIWPPNPTKGNMSLVVFGVSDQVLHKPGCAVTEDG